MLYEVITLAPDDVLAVEGTGDDEVGHAGGGGGAVPVVDSGRAPEHVAGLDFDDLAVLRAGAADARGDDDVLPGVV